MNVYRKVIQDPKVLNLNEKLLRQVGCTKDQIEQFKDRSFEALPLWLRKRFKHLTKKAQKESAHLKPGPGQKAFYLSGLPQQQQLSKRGRHDASKKV